MTEAAFGGPLPIVAGVDWGDWDEDGDQDLVMVEGREGIYDGWGFDENSHYWWFAHHRYNDDGFDIFEVDTPGEDPLAYFRYLGTACGYWVARLPEMVKKLCALLE